MSISASVLIVLVIALRSVTLHKLPRQLFLVLWGIVIARLLIPGSVPVLPQLSPQVEVAAAIDQVNTHTAAVLQLPERSALHTGMFAHDIAFTAFAAGEPEQPFLKPELLSAIWLGVAALLLITLAVIYCRSKRELRTALPLQRQDPVIEAWRARHPLRRKLTILTFDRMDTPVTCGIWRPKIILPTTLNTRNAPAMNYILTHEYMHIRYFDTAWKLAASVALCLHWFNPLVWLMVFYLNRELEMVCDARVIRKLGEEHKADYALCLLEVAEQQKGFTPLYTGFSKCDKRKDRVYHEIAKINGVDGGYITHSDRRSGICVCRAVQRCGKQCQYSEFCGNECTGER
ncbi:M56 family metallopeptidase [Paenibacillus rhizoplanae]|uniref:M56 family metallopeptidase n=1 Tax=Paenibacillus rhizoplanae TaxID=1917181 RepID=UPI0036211B53